jgi:hypothetical protein
MVTLATGVSTGVESRPRQLCALRPEVKGPAKEAVTQKSSGRRLSLPRAHALALRRRRAAVRACFDSACLETVERGSFSSLRSMARERLADGRLRVPVRPFR